MKFHGKQRNQQLITNGESPLGRQTKAIPVDYCERVETAQDEGKIWRRGVPSCGKVVKRLLSCTIVD